MTGWLFVVSFISVFITLIYILFKTELTLYLTSPFFLLGSFRKASLNVFMTSVLCPTSWRLSRTFPRLPLEANWRTEMRHRRSTNTGFKNFFILYRRNTVHKLLSLRLISMYVEVEFLGFKNKKVTKRRRLATSLRCRVSTSTLFQKIKSYHPAPPPLLRSIRP